MDGHWIRIGSRPVYYIGYCRQHHEVSTTAVPKGKPSVREMSINLGFFLLCYYLLSNIFIKRSVSLSIYYIFLVVNRES